MPRRNTRSRSSESSDPGDAALEAQTRILRLKKDRDENIKAAAADFDTALAELRAKVIAWQEDLQRQREERRQYCSTEITRLTDRRGDIEAQMVEIVTNAQRMVGDLEDMMLAGYEGRENDAATALEKVIIHQHGS
ncbi:hypothetical protein ACSS6W_001400 [Trichoderma asperelloides]|nr:hypothetical protein LI328DRAFT_156151 [Trichoderma asperelloides]